MPDVPLRIEFLTFDGCPHAEVGHQHAVEALRAENAVGSVDRVEVNSPELARDLRFLGSPSLRVNGEDIEPGADDRSEFGLMCRTYTSEGVTTGAPSVQMIRKAIRTHLDRVRYR